MILAMTCICHLKFTVILLSRRRHFYFLWDGGGVRGVGVGVVVGGLTLIWGGRGALTLNGVEDDSLQFFQSRICLVHQSHENVTLTIMVPCTSTFWFWQRDDFYLLTIYLIHSGLQRSLITELCKHMSGIMCFDSSFIQIKTLRSLRIWDI